ncbi:MAG: hypothetical protein ACTSX9_00995 [Candidatus Njordarchaeales archaeon]
MVKLTLPDGRTIEGEEIKFEPIKEDWNIYRLEDGRILKVKLVLVKVYKTSERDPITGEPIYVTVSTNVVTTSSKQ